MIYNISRIVVMVVFAVLPFSATAASSVWYVSDLNWGSAVNGLGPAERNKSNGNQAAGDGRTLTIGGRTYAKGIGAHAASNIKIPLGGRCTTFVSDIGIDDEVRPNGSVVFQLWADGVKLYDSGILSSGSGARRVNLDLTGKNQIALVITDAGDGPGFDHADWAGAQITCNDQTTYDGGWTTTGGLVRTAPVVIDGKQDVTIRGVKISNTSGPCITIRNRSRNIRVENSELGPCSGGGIVVDLSEAVVLNNNYIHDTGTFREGVDIYGSQNVAVTNSKIVTTRSGVYVLSSRQIKIDHNSFLNVMGRFPRGQFVQFDKVTGPGNRITCNEGVNVLGSSYPEEIINLFKSHGDPSDSILIAGNKIKGGGPSRSGGGIMLGDSGGSFQIARNNILVNPGQQGISVASGHDIKVLNNQIYSKSQPFSNVGLTVWNQSSSACYAITAQGNRVKFLNSAGESNPYYNHGNCGSVAGWSSNSWNAPLTEAIYNSWSISTCRY